MSILLTKKPEELALATASDSVSNVTANAVCVQSRKLKPTRNTAPPTSPAHTAPTTRAYTFTCLFVNACIVVAVSSSPKKF